MEFTEYSLILECKKLWPKLEIHLNDDGHNCVDGIETYYNLPCLINIQNGQTFMLNVCLWCVSEMYTFTLSLPLKQ